MHFLNLNKLRLVGYIFYKIGLILRKQNCKTPEDLHVVQLIVKQRVASFSVLILMGVSIL